MKSSKSSPKRTSKGYSKEISGFELFYQLTFMSATAAAGISRNRLFALASQVPIPPAQYFKEIHGLVENMRYNYPDACRIVGERIKSEEMRTFLLRLSDALRSGEPMAPFMAREAQVQGNNYQNEYEREIESLKKWSDGYTSVMVSVALVVIINLVSTMIYNIGISAMVTMVMTACVVGFVVAWILSRAAPQETMSLSWSTGSQEQRRSIKVAKIVLPVTAIAFPALLLLGMSWGWLFISVALILVPLGVTSMLADQKINKQDAEVSPFLRSLGGTATARGTTLGNALIEIEIDSFPVLEPDIDRLTQRLRALVKPVICWNRFALEIGSLLISQASGVFFSAVNLGGDPETTGNLSSLFATKTAMLRAKRRGVAASFSWLTIVMHAVMGWVMIFLLEIIKQFIKLLQDAMMSMSSGGEKMQALTGSVMAFSTPPIQLLDTITVGMILVLSFINAYAIVANEGSHILKSSFYASILMFLSGIGFLVVPSLVKMVM